VEHFIGAPAISSAARPGRARRPMPGAIGSAIVARRNWRESRVCRRLGLGICTAERLAVSSRCRGTDHQEASLGRPWVGELVGDARRHLNTASRDEKRGAVLGAHLSLAGEQVKELASVLVPVPLFTRASRYSFLDHRKVGVVEQVPTVGSVAPGVMLGDGCADCDRRRHCAQTRPPGGRPGWPGSETVTPPDGNAPQPLPPAAELRLSRCRNSGDPLRRGCRGHPVGLTRCRLFNLR
jgi:hypothetical protein